MSNQVQRLPVGSMFLTLVFSETNSIASTASVSECLILLPLLVPEHLTLSRDEWSSQFWVRK
jgi:hypothetical protein